MVFQSSMIFFDIDETLFDNGSAQNAASRKLYQNYSVLHGLYSVSEFPKIWDEVTEKYVQEYLSKKMSFQEQRRRRLREIFQIDLTENELDKIISVYLKHYEENWRLFDDVISCLNNLKGHRLGIISNGDSAQQRQKLGQLNILDRFEVVVISGDMGISKPNPEIFQSACKKAKVNPEKCVHIGDSLTIDARGARDAGLSGIWLNRKQEKNISSDIAEIRCLDQLPDIIP